MVEAMRVSGDKIIWKASVCTDGKMDVFILESILMTRNMDMAYISGRILANTLDTGQMESNMALEFTQ